uniref:Endonuclease/exonuclease/phosphatase domain-containing protein n=1 Tax=Aegilops tauschii subsp. strangulata TaxID=200361 RepID=A0A453IZC2_AEGTS
EIIMSGGLYTWSNKQEHPTLEKLDRVLMSSDWEDLFPLVSVHKMVKEISDHNPLLLDGGGGGLLLLEPLEIDALSLIMPG